jgi:hypothetical protein
MSEQLVSGEQQQEAEHDCRASARGLTAQKSPKPALLVQSALGRNPRS